VYITPAVIGVVLISALIAKFWLIPVIAAGKITSLLEQFWDGPVAVDKVQFNYFQPSVIRQISLCDGQKREWLSTDFIKVGIEDLIRLRPKVSRLEVGKLRVNAYLANHSITHPIKLQELKRQVDMRKGQLDITRVLINEALINIERDNKSKITCTLNLNAEKKDRFYDVRLTQAVSEPNQVFRLTGRINPADMQANLDFDIDRRFTNAQMDVILALMNVPETYKADGRLKAALSLSGILNQAAALQLSGTINLNSWNILSANQVVVRDFDASATCGYGRIDVNSLKANVCSGFVEADLFMENVRPQPVRIGGHLSAAEIDLAQLASVLGRQKKIAKGTGSFHSSFTMAGTDISSLRGQGLVILNDTGMGGFVVIPKIFQFIGLAVSRPDANADVAATFSMSGPLFTINTAQAASALGALRAEQGGTVNVQTGQLDFYVVTAELDGVKDIIRAVPLAGHLVDLQDKLTRLHIKGHWSDPTAKLITKEPLTDIKQAAVEFFRNIVANEGQIPEQTFNMFRQLFENGAAQK